MKIFVTGGAGFIGSHIADAYLADGHDVVILDNLSTGKRENLNPKARFYQVDICSPEIATIFAQEKPEILNHHAAQIDVRRSVSDPKFDLRVNVEGLVNLMEAGRCFGLKKIIFASSGGAIYGEQEVFPATEGHPTRPSSPYGLSKLAGEQYLSYYKTTYDIQTVVLRYANVYGPRQNPHGEAGVVAIFLNKMLRGETPIIYGDGKQTRDFVFVDDVVEANRLVLQDGVEGIYNVGTGLETDITTLFQRLRKLLDLSCDAYSGPPQAGEQRRSVISPRQIKKALGWFPKISIENGLCKTMRGIL